MSFIHHGTMGHEQDGNEWHSQVLKQSSLVNQILELLVVDILKDAYSFMKRLRKSRRSNNVPTLW